MRFRPVNSAGNLRVLFRTQGDLNGDGYPEGVTVAGMPVSEGGFVKDIVLLIRSGATGRTSRVQPPQDQGYSPRVNLVNLVGGPGLEILLTINTGGSGGIINAYVYSYANSTPRLIFDSGQFDEAFSYTVTYLDGYTVEVKSLANDATYRIDISQRGAEYLDQIYGPDGVLLKPVEGFVDPISGLYPVDFDGNGVYELLAIQAISGLFHADGLGYVQSVLAWDGERFALDRQNVAIFSAP